MGGDGDGGRGLRSPVVGTRRMVGRVKVGRGRGERKGRQVGQFEGFLFSAKGSMHGMRGGLFTVISILRGVCYGRIVSRRGRVAHLRATDDEAAVRPSCPCLPSVCSIGQHPPNTLFLSRQLAPPSLGFRGHPLGESAGLSNWLIPPRARSRPAALRASCIDRHPAHRVYLPGPTSGRTRLIILC